jgi:hypothetical protein
MALGIARESKLITVDCATLALLAIDQLTTERDEKQMLVNAIPALRRELFGARAERDYLRERLAEARSIVARIAALMPPMLVSGLLPALTEQLQALLGPEEKAAMESPD